MNFVQETLHASLTKDLSFSILEQIQNSNSALQEMLYRLASTRDYQKLQAIRSKIERVQNFKFVKQSVLQILQNDENAVVFQWILDSLYNNQLLYSLIKKEELTIKKSIYQIVKQTFLNEQTLEDHLQQNELAKTCLQKLNQLKSEAQLNKIPSRLSVKQLDQKCQRLSTIIQQFDKKVQKFNFLIWNLMKKVFEFQQKISKSFISFISQTKQEQIKIINQHSLNQSKSNPNSRILQIQSKHSQPYIQDQTQTVELIKIKRPYKVKNYSSQKQTPRKKLNTQQQKQNGYMSNLYEYRPSQTSQTGLLRNYDNPVIRKRDSRDANRLTLTSTNNYLQDNPKKHYDSDLLNNFNKTLQDLSFHRQRGSYLMQNSNPTSMISQKNSRSSISYTSKGIYPMR